MYQIESYFYPTRSMTDTTVLVIVFPRPKKTLNIIGNYIIYNHRAHSTLKKKSLANGHGFDPHTRYLAHTVSS